jgi:hypothetical protein
MAKELSENSAAHVAGQPNSPPVPARIALIQALEEFRTRVHRQLDALEALSRARAQQGSRSLLEREQQMQQRARDLEHVQSHMRAEADRWERERQAMLEQIEHDRRLLAEAWERLEREQVTNFAAVQTPALANAVVAPTPWPVTLSSATGRDHPVAEEVLRQFQSLRRDVRRNSSASLAV